MEQQVKAPPEIKNVAQFLRSGSAGIKIRVGALNGKRLDYFKGALLACVPASPQIPSLVVFARRQIRD
jgi:translocation protein SEC62